MGFPRAINTLWRGYHFRSRLEARWAVALAKLGIPFEYEKEGFELPSGKYLPDFWLPFSEDYCSEYPEAGSWFEIKGIKPTDIELTKLVELSISTKHNCTLVWGPPWSFKIYRTHNSGHHWWDDGLSGDVNPDSELMFLLYRFSLNDNYEEALEKAKSARFEFGETPI
jgi:hypothetical protein